MSRRGIKRRRANSSSDEIQRIVREKVHIPDDTWLQALKFLTCTEWSEKRFACRQINGIAQRNISRLPKMMIMTENVAMYYLCTFRSMKVNREKLNEDTIVAFDTILQKKDCTKWLQNRGFAFNAPKDILAENVLIDAKNWTSTPNSIVHVSILGSAQKNIPLSGEEEYFPWFRNLPLEEKFRKSVLFYAQFNPELNQNSWNCLAQFLQFAYHPMSYIKQVEMFAVNQKFIDSLKCNVDSIGNEPRYIQCESFKLAPGRSFNSDSLKWLARNVRAETIRIRDLSGIANNVVLVNFLLDPSGAEQCASEQMEIVTNNPVTFFDILIEKFLAIALVENAIPAILFYNCIRESWLLSSKARKILGPNLVAQEVDSQGAHELYVITNGQNRMRVSFYRPDDDVFDCNVRIYSV